MVHGVPALENHQKLQQRLMVHRYLSEVEEVHGPLHPNE